MKRRAFFVTYVIILGLLALLAVNGVPLLQAMIQAKTQSANDLAQAGNERIQQSLLNEIRTLVVIAGEGSPIFHGVFPVDRIFS